MKLATLLDIFFPPRCIFCGTVMASSAREVCPHCENHLPFCAEGDILRKIGNDTCAVTFYYDGVVQQGIRAMKFGAKRGRAKRFAPYLARTVAEQLGGTFDAVTYVPIHPLRRLRRGFDQTQLLAATAAEIWQVPLLTTLRKIRNNPPQSTVKHPQERRENVKNVYAAVQTSGFYGKRLLLIDDVVTSGQTLAACVRVLMAAGAQSVVCAALAGGHAEKTLENHEKSRIGDLQNEKDDSIIYD